MLKQLIGIFLFLLPFTAMGQKGWEYIRTNDHKKAKEEFLSDLQRDSTNASALKGMIVLSEMSGDQLSYVKYINTLINNHWDEDLYLLFCNEYKGSPSKVLEQTALSLRAKIDAQLNLADRDFYNRKFTEAQKVYDKLFGNYQWTYIGPFKNLNGSGYDTKFEVENENYDGGKIYKDEDGDELKWVDPPARDNSEAISFRDFLSGKSSSVYFANLFFTVPADRTIELRLSRRSPVKIWLDDDLVFTSNDRTAFEWDHEIVKVQVKAGTHRLLVKSADYIKETRPTSTYTYGMDDPNGENETTNYGFLRRSNSSNADLQVRITDKNGELLTDVSTSPSGKYTPAKYQPETGSNDLVTELLRKTENDPADLFNFFVLEKAAEKYEVAPYAEKTFIQFLRANKDMVLAKYLAFRICFENGKKEKAYGLLGGIDQDRTPIFDILFEKLQEIDKNNDEDKYVSALDFLTHLSPSNMNVIKRNIEYFEKKGQAEKKESYVQDLIKKYPDYEQSLKHELKQDLSDKKKEQKENFKEEKQQSYHKDLKRTKKDIKKFYYTPDYFNLIDHYRSRNDMSQVLALFDEMIRVQPYFVNHRYEKAKYLMEEEKYDACITELKTAIRFRPFKADYYELIGDAYYAQNNKGMALEYFKLAHKYSNRSAIDVKIEKIEGTRQYKKLFKTPAFNDILVKDEWKEKYKDEESIVLMYTKDQVLTPDNETEIYQKFMVKILTDAGTKKWIEYDFGFMGTIKSARIIKSNGAEVIPDGRGGYKVFKNLEEGDIIELEGTSIYSIAANTIANEYYTRTYLNFDAPVYYEKYEVAVPEGKYFGFYNHKLEGEVQKSNDRGFDFYKWEYQYIPGVASEEAPIDKMDKWASIMVSTMPDWSKLVTWYERKTYRKLEAGYEVKEILDSIIKPGMTQQQKVETIYNYLTREIKYSYVTFLQSGYVPKDPDQTVCSGIGDCKDVATLMITMLRQVGVESYYVLVKTNDYFHMKTLPSLYFNHAIAGYYIDGKLNFLDMTTDFYPYYILPTMDANAWALLIKEGQKELIRLPEDNIDSLKNTASITINAQLKKDRSISLQVSAVHRGSIGGNIREVLTQRNKDEQKNYVLKMMGKGLFENLNVESYSFDNLQEISAPLYSKYVLDAENYCDRVSSMLVFRIPYMSPITSHPAMLAKKRENQLDVDDIVNVAPTWQKVKITFPEGYDLLEMPKDIDIKNKYGSYKVTFKRERDGLTVEKFQSFSKSVIAVSEFEEFKQYYQLLLDIDSTKIALKKK
jgi:transglutaminase-like putative cysteine protease